ncbi:MAG: hypothetical protein EoVTN8_400 [Fluviibacter phosphoraccumulans EoVTN8]
MERGFKVFFLTRGRKFINKSIPSSRIVTLKACNKAVLRKLINSKMIDVVVHTATMYESFGVTDSQLTAVNYKLPVEIVQSLTSTNVKSFINIDTTLHRGVNGYAKSKYKTSKYLLGISNRKPGLIKNLKTPMHFGMNGDFFQKIIKELSETVKLEMTSCEDSRSFIHYVDLVNAIIKLIVVGSTYQIRRSKFMAAGNEFMSLKKLILKISIGMRSKCIICFGALKSRAFEGCEDRISINSLKLLGWSPKKSINEYIDELIYE